MGSRQVVKGICPEKIFGLSNVRKKFLTLFLDCPEKIFNPLNGTLTEIFLATGGGGGSPKSFRVGRHRISQGKLADTPPIKRG
jgi:hypothetical protein